MNIQSIKEKPPKLPLPSGKPAIMALTTHKPARGVESWNDITRANLHHLLRRLSPDYTLAQTPSNPHPPAVAPAEKPLSKSDIRDCAPESTFPNLNPSRHSKISKDSQPPSSGPSLSKGSCDHPVTIGGRKGEQEKVESSRGQEPKDKTSLKISRSSPPTTTQPLISLPNHEHDGRNLQVARRSGKSNHGISWGVTHTSTKRKRDDELDTVDRPAKATRRDDDGERQSVGHAPEAPNTSSLPSEPHIPRQHGQHKSPLSKFGVIQWANQLGSSAYLRNMGKADGKVYNSLIDTLSTIESYKDHRALTLKMLKETKLAVELHKFVDQGSDSPESTLANEIYAHWQSKFCF